MKFGQSTIVFILLGLTFLKLISSSSSPSSVSSYGQKSTTTTTRAKVYNILSKIHQWQRIHSKFQKTLPFVTITYAQTLDGMIAITNNNKDGISTTVETTFHEETEDVASSNNDKDKIKEQQHGINNAVSSNYPLSCSESFQLTHALRSIHDGIIIGGNTLRYDNPRLNNRLWKKENEAEANKERIPSTKTATTINNNVTRQPIPIILDTNLNHIMSMIESNTKIKCVATHEKVIVCCNEDAYKSYNDQIQLKYPCKTLHLLPCQMNEVHFQLEKDDDDDDENIAAVASSNSSSEKKNQEFKAIGGGLNLQILLEKLQFEHNISSVMVEGGSSIISSFLEQGISSDCVDCVCITIVPKMIGGKKGLLAVKSCDLLMRQGDNYISGEKSQTRGLDYDPMNVSWHTLGCDTIFLASC